MDEIKVVNDKNYYLTAYEFQFDGNVDTLTKLLKDKVSFKWAQRDNESFGDYMVASTEMGIVRVLEIDNTFMLDFLLKSPSISEEKWRQSVEDHIKELTKLGLKSFKACEAAY